jgi:DNA replication and repair protein RecF
MQIQELKLLNFRNYDKMTISFHSHLNIIYGPNGSGKTNLVEAIYVLALTRSFKQINDKTLIKNGTNLTKLEGVINNKYQTTYKVIITPDGKKVKVDNNKITKISDYISKINIVLFNPNDLKMVKDTPSIRRKYLNIAISQLSVSYLKKLNDYNKLIKLRNAYLKKLNDYNKLIKIRNAYLKKMYLNGNSLKSYLDVVTEKLIDLGMDIYDVRYKYLNLINKYIGEIYKKINGTGNLKVCYISDFKDKSREELVRIYKKNLQKDLSFGKTNFGIHHDDFIFILDDLEIKDYGSEGQQKNAVISWKFSEISIFKEEKNVMPILILDDLLSELDIEKIKNILALIEDDVQTFITTTEIEKVSSLLNNESYKKIYIESERLEGV